MSYGVWFKYMPAYLYLIMVLQKNTENVFMVLQCFLLSTTQIILF